MKAPRIISIGEVLWDVFPDRERFGGAPANFACHAAIGGGDVMILSAVGDDPHGQQAIKILEGYGIDTRLIQVAGGFATGTVEVALDSNGKPTYTITDNAAWDSVGWQDELADCIGEADVVYFGTLAQRAEPSCGTIRRCLSVARDAGVPRVCDINLRVPFFDADVIRTSIELASVVKLSDEELFDTASALGISSKDHEESLRQMVGNHSLDLAVMTRGAEGAMLVSPSGVVHQPSVPTEVHDTVGAGDAFTASFVLGMLADIEHRELLKVSCEAASVVCGMSGAVPSLPMAANVNRKKNA